MKTCSLLNGCLLALISSACGAPRPAEAPSAPMDSAAESVAAPMAGAESSKAADAAPAPAPPPMAPSAPAGVAPGEPAAQAATPTTTVVSREMLDIEAHIMLQVSDVRGALKSVRAIAARSGGVVTQENVSSGDSAGMADLTLRVPSSATHGVFDELERVGKLLSQNVTSRDIGKEYFDASLRVSSLEATLHRYEQILGKADKVDEILRIEAEIGRIRAEIEQVKGNLRWLSDRAARATLHLSLRESAPPVVAQPVEPQAKFFPGLRAPILLDVNKKGEDLYVGGGFSLRFSRRMSLDLDLLKRTDSSERGLDALLASLGGEVFSERLGGGERRFFNPYLGWRIGYARFDQNDQVMLGGTLGVELVKTQSFCVDLEARNYLVLGGDRGTHYSLQPALAANIAF